MIPENGEFAQAQTATGYILSWRAPHTGMLMAVASNHFILKFAWCGFHGRAGLNREEAVCTLAIPRCAIMSIPGPPCVAIAPAVSATGLHSLVRC